jgi:TetR/AcrR family acrAB operon transcriptional repressor
VPRKKLEDAKPRLLSAGLSLFSKLGTERVNSNAIARRARVGIGTFYAHYKDKHELLQEIQLRTLTGLRDVRVAALRRADPTPEAQARATIAAVVAFARRHPHAYRVTLGRERASATKHRPVVSESTRPAAAVLRQLQADGRLDPNLNVDLAARAYSSTEVGTVLWWLDDPARADADELVETLLRLHPVVAGRVARD